VLPKFSPSQLATYSSCPVKWDYVYLQGLKPKGKALHFDIGTYFHELSHVYYHMIAAGQIPGSDEAFAAIASRMKQDVQGLTPENAKVFETVTKMAADFVLRQSPSIDHGIKILGVEHAYELEVVLPSGKRVILHGIIDLLYQDIRRSVWVRDHKTGDIKGKPTVEGLSLDGQLLTYGAVARELGYPTPGIEISWINSYNYKERTKKDFKDLFHRVRWQPTDEVYDRFWAELLMRIDRMMKDKPLHIFNRQACTKCVFNKPCHMELVGQSPVNFISGNYEKVEREYSIPVDWTEDAGEHSAGNNSIEVSFG
jgi:hypothetical protein